MAPINRLLWQNFSALGSAILTASSTVSGRSVSWLKHQRRSKKWRSATGWGFSTGFNDRLRYEEGGVARIAYLDGDYSTGALAATAIQTAMDAAGVDPLELSPTLWLDASQMDLADGADVASWADVSGNGRDLDTSTGTQTYTRDAINGRPAVHFGDDGYLYAAASAVQLDDLFTAGAGTLVMVAWVDTDHTANDVLFSSSSGNNNLYVVAGGNLYANAYDGSADAITGAATPVTGAWYVFTYTYDGANADTYANDQDSAAADGTVASGDQTALAEDFRLGGDGGSPLKGYVAEVLTFGAALSEENRRRLVAYLEAKYALSTSTTAATWANTYTATYAAGTFTLARGSGAATLEFPWTTEAGIGPDLGFDTSADDTGGTSYAADAAAYQSRHQLTVDLGSVRGCLASVVSDHNISAAATVTLEGSDTGDWPTTTPDYSSAFTGTEVGTTLCQFFAEEQRRYWRLVIEDTTNSAGYVEVGLWYVGSYFQPNKQHKGGHTLQREELSNVGYADHGAPFFDDKPTMKGWRLLYHPVLDSDRSQFQTMLDYVKTSRQFFVSFDAAADEGDSTHYVFLPGGVNIRHLPNSVALWSVGLDLQEAPE